MSTGICIEFKRDRSCKLSDEQEEFRRKCEKRGIPAYVVYSADEAIELVKKADWRCDRDITDSALTERAAPRLDAR